MVSAIREQRFVSVVTMRKTTDMYKDDVLRLLNDCMLDNSTSIDEDAVLRLQQFGIQLCTYNNGDGFSSYL
uniref:Uncharacterized protein n=1 Tax=Arion vulgaris TaxID=1028688 RepID=A0A0B6ZDV9_9EUPU